MHDNPSAAVGKRPSDILASSRRPETLGSVLEGAVSLAMGEPYFTTPAPIIDAAVSALTKGNTRYEALTGSPRLREAIASDLSRRAGNSIRASEVVPTHGASAGLGAVILAVVNPGDRVVIPEPTYSLYADQVAMAGGVVKWVPTRIDGSLDMDALAEAIPGAKLTILCNPGNPSGHVLTAGDVRAVVELVARSGRLVLSDEAYCDIVFDGRTFFSALELREFSDHVVVSRTFSKSFAMTGWRLGYVVASERVAAAVGLVHRSLNGALNSFVQEAALAALALPEKYYQDMVAQYTIRRDLVVDQLTGIDEVELATPQGAFYAFPRVKSNLNSDELTTRMAAAGVLVRSGREYGPTGEGHFRISFATDMESLTRGMARVVSVLTKELR